jgi:hypothetical protein
MGDLNESYSAEQLLVNAVDPESEPISDNKKLKTELQKPLTRQMTELFGFGPAVCTSDATITGCRLPTCLQVLRCMMYHCNMATSTKRPGSVGATSRFTTAKLVLKQITTFYEKSNIPMVSERRACEKIVKLLDDNNKLRAINKDRRDTPATKQKLEENQQMLASTFQLWPPNVESLVKNEEDLAFLQSMKSDRVASFGVFDKLLAQKVDRRNQRAAAAETRQKRLCLEARIPRNMEASTNTALTLTDDSDCDTTGCDSPAAGDDGTSEDEQTFVTPRTHKKCSNGKKPIGTPAFIPHDILSKPTIVSLATRLKMTPTQQSAFTQGLISASGGDVAMVAASYATADRSRRKVTAVIASNIKEQWVPPKLCTLHWDGKLTATLQNHRLTEERLTVSVGDATEMKLLGVPSYRKATDQAVGSVIADVTLKLVNEWNCTDRIVNLAFDTTSANTGHLSAACIAIQNRLQRAVLWSGCRHHIGEVLLTHVFNDLKIECSKSPDVMLFTRLRTNWGLLPHCSTQSMTFQPGRYSSDAQQLLATLRAEAVARAKQFIQFARDDYHEFTELALVFLNATQEEVNFHRPGALHKARWMAKVIYSLKIAMSENSIDQLPPGTITTRPQVVKIREFVTFVTHIYLQWWLCCKESVDAPWNDIQLFKQLIQYEVVNRDISKSSIQAFQRHLWYLTAEMVPLALFSSKVPVAERQALAESLLKIQPDCPVQNPSNRFGSGWGKPQFPTTINLSTRLCDLVDHDSWFTMFLLQIDSSFLHLPVTDWETTDAYVNSAANLKAVNVVNDAAERGVKLSTDFVDVARSDEHFQNVLQVVETNRKTTKNLRVQNKKDNI